MELGLDLDDSYFTEKVKQKHTPVSYNAKVCYSQWFLSEKADNGRNDMATVYKFRGDYYYQRKEFESAVMCYKNSSDRLGEHNRTMRRELIESLARCYMQMGQFELSKQYTEQVMTDCLTIDHYCHGLLLRQQLNRCSGDLLSEASVLHQLISIYADNTQFWLKLAEVYEKIRDHIHTTSCSKPNIAADGKLDDETVNDGEGKESVATSEHVDDLTKEITNGVKEEENVKKCFCEKSSEKQGNDTGQDADKFSVEKLHISDSEAMTEKASLCEENIRTALLSSHSIDLVLVTCYFRSRLKLLSVQGTVGSFIRERNKQLVEMIDSKIESLSINKSLLDKVNQFIRQDMTEDDTDEPSKPDHYQDIKVIMKIQVSFEDFNNRWFSWIKDTS